MEWRYSRKREGGTEEKKDGLAARYRSPIPASFICSTILPRSSASSRLLGGGRLLDVLESLPGAEFLVAPTALALALMSGCGTSFDPLVGERSSEGER